MSSEIESAARGRDRLPLTIDMEASSPRDRSRFDYVLLALVACLLSAFSFLYYWRSGELLLYGDAVAHMNIARRVFDSRMPGFFQLGTVWLPLPHVLMLPFTGFTWMWQTGVGGAIPSMLAYVAGVVGIHRLVRTGLNSIRDLRAEARVSAWLAALVYALNPNLLYLQTTAMTEPLYLALCIWATVFVSEFAQHLYLGDDRSARRSLLYCGLILVLGMMTRYDGWFMAIAYACAIAILLITAGRRSGLGPLYFLYERSWRPAVLTFCFLLVITPIGWFVYNAYEFHDPLAFARGPYSAKGIEARSRKAGDPHHPGWNAPKVGATYFIESAKLNVASTDRSGRVWLYSALLASVILAGFMRPLWPWLLLWAPIPFYAISMAWGGVPIFIPKWWPFSYYNVRYGTQLLPVFAVFGALLLFLFLRRFSSRNLKLLVSIAAGIFVAQSYYQVWRETPVCLQEARVNSVDRMGIETKLSSVLSQLPKDSTVLMFIGQHSGALQQIGFPLKHTINECQKRYWHSALLAPAWSAAYVVATDGDPVWHSVKARPEDLVKIAEITHPRQASIAVYRSTRR